MSYERAAAVVCDNDECGQHVLAITDLHGARIKARAQGWHTGADYDLCPTHAITDPMPRKWWWDLEHERRDKS